MCRAGSLSADTDVNIQPGFGALSKVDVLKVEHSNNLNTYIWVVWLGVDRRTENTKTCGWRLRVQIVLTILGSIVNMIWDQPDHLMYRRIFTLILIKIWGKWLGTQFGFVRCKSYEKWMQREKHLDNTDQRNSVLLHVWNSLWCAILVDWICLTMQTGTLVFGHSFGSYFCELDNNHCWVYHLL